MIGRQWSSSLAMAFSGMRLGSFGGEDGGASSLSSPKNLLEFKHFVYISVSLELARGALPLRDRAT